jgi:DNA polymerase III subunit gamma/tau
LYLQYRPKTFTDLIGQRHIIDILIAQAKSNQLGHSYLLFWPRGTGKTSTARLLAKVMNCTTFTADGQPDLLNDPAARLIDENKTLDFVEIDAASHTGVDNIREEIIDKALYPPAHLKKKVYVIDEVHMLSKGAFNALLKIMEEPPSYLIFILATTELHKVPDTILSRCQVFNFKQLTIDEIVGRLEHIASKENIAYQPQALRLIAKLSSGALRDGIKYLEQISILGEVTEHNVAKFLGVVSDSLLTQAMELLQGNDAATWIWFLDGLVTQWVDLQNFWKEILIWLDEHFLEAPTRYAALAGMMREIIAEAKRYPHPLLLRKAKTWLWFGETWWLPIPAPVKQAEPPEIATPEPTQEDTSAQKSIPDQVIPEATLEKREETPAADPSTTPNETDMPTQDPPSLFETTQPISTVSPISPSSTTSSPTSLSPELIIETLVAGTKNPMTRAALKQHVIIQEITETTIGAIVINEQFYHTIIKPEISHELEHTLKEQLHYHGHLKWTYMTKEERIMRQM